MELPRGITGFRDGGDPMLPQCDQRAFRAQCHRAARVLRGRNVSIETPVQYVANFSRVTFEFDSGRISVVLNSIKPIVAFVKPPSESAILRFVDHSPLAGFFAASGAYRVISATEAQSPLLETTCQNLAEAELNQIRYWRPATIGEVIFNHWD